MNKKLLTFLFVLLLGASMALVACQDTPADDTPSYDDPAALEQIETLRQNLPEIDFLVANPYIDVAKAQAALSAFELYQSLSQGDREAVRDPSELVIASFAVQYFSIVAMYNQLLDEYVPETFEFEREQLGDVRELVKQISDQAPKVTEDYAPYGDVHLFDYQDQSIDIAYLCEDIDYLLEYAQWCDQLLDLVEELDASFEQFPSTADKLDRDSLPTYRAAIERAVDAMYQATLNDLDLVDNALPLALAWHYMSQSVLGDIITKYTSLTASPLEYVDYLLVKIYSVVLQSTILDDWSIYVFWQWELDGYIASLEQSQREQLQAHYLFEEYLEVRQTYMQPILDDLSGIPDDVVSDFVQLAYRYSFEAEYYSQTLGASQQFINDYKAFSVRFALLTPDQQSDFGIHFGAMLQAVRWDYYFIYLTTTERELYSLLLCVSEDHYWMTANAQSEYFIDSYEVFMVQYNATPTAQRANFDRYFGADLAFFAAEYAALTI